MKRICHQEFNAQELVTKYPARLNNRNKEIVFGVSSPPVAPQKARATGITDSAGFHGTRGPELHPHLGLIPKTSIGGSPVLGRCPEP